MEKSQFNIIEDIRNSPAHRNLSDEEIQMVRDTLIELAQILIINYTEDNLSKK